MRDSLLRGVIGSTTVSGTVSWGSSPYGVIFRVMNHQAREELPFFAGLFASFRHFARRVPLPQRVTDALGKRLVYSLAEK